MDLKPCVECRQCNHKGKPSVMRGSSYCDAHKKYGVQVERVGILSRFVDRWISRHEKKKQKNDTKEQPDQQSPSKGFRPSFFWRH